MIASAPGGSAGRRATTATNTLAHSRLTQATDHIAEDIATIAEKAAPKSETGIDGTANAVVLTDIDRWRWASAKIDCWRQPLDFRKRKRDHRRPVRRLRLSWERGDCKGQS